MQSLNQAFTIRLDRSNYLLWRTQMLNIVIANGVEEMIDGSRPCLPKFLENSKSTNPDFQIWQRQNLLVMCWIYSSLFENVMSQIIGLTSTSEIWSALEKFFFAASKARIMQLPDYNSFVVSITSKHEPLHLEETHNMLLSYKHRLEQQNATDETNLLQASVAFLQSQGNNYKKIKIKGLVNASFKEETLTRVYRNSIRNSLVVADVVSIPREIQVEVLRCCPRNCDLQANRSWSRDFVSFPPPRKVLVLKDETPGMLWRIAMRSPRWQDQLKMLPGRTHGDSPKHTRSSVLEDKDSSRGGNDTKSLLQLV
ncbi:hypothetical protein CK203_047297 [Vitis vinifera]|uniref:Retrotransposon Copia-like N-terminal domain-containing protein n=1 Tax=Vitis vinifera TaxID=29760 RepID=A0A438HHS5_VITVI|nr:hypothetical protein CK203_047297 [Vitis vinifera]